MSTLFNLGRAPIDFVKDTARLAFWPVHFGKTLATNAVDTAFEIIGTKTTDTPSSESNDESVYHMTKVNLRIAALIYYYTELRSEAKKSLELYAKEKNLSFDFSNPNEPCDILVLYNGLKLVEDRLAALRSSPENTIVKHRLSEYEESLNQLATLQKRFNLDDGDMDIFKTYFDILAEPKSLVDMKRDTLLFDGMLSTQFRFFLGGSEFNRRKIKGLIGSSEEIYVHRINDSFITSSMDLKGIIKGFDAEAVWAILVCAKQKTITVVFRGSINAGDWMANLHKLGRMTDLALPGFISRNVDPVATGKKYGRVHQGFYDYLFGETKQDVSIKSKGEEIMGILKADFFDKPEYKDYSLSVTGHSLGGALSTLFAFRAATENNEDGSSYFKTVTNVSIASPFVGDQGFREAFYDMERKRRIRHLRIANYQDPVPLIPPVTVNPIPNGFEEYKHVGMGIRLYKGGDLLAPAYRRFYPKMGSQRDGLRNTLHNGLILGSSLSPIEYHLCPEYERRLESPKTKEDLSKLYLDDLYANKDITGWDYLLEK